MNIIDPDLICALRHIRSKLHVKNIIITTQNVFILFGTYFAICVKIPKLNNLPCKGEYYG